VNGVEVDVRRHDLRTDPTPRARTIAANLLAPLLLVWAHKLAAAPPERRPRQLIVSGLLVDEAHRVAEAFAPAGLTETGRLTSGEWAAVLLEAGTSPHGQPRPR
jgi:ribosomal protein L11 methylase PrmA